MKKSTNKKIRLSFILLFFIVILFIGIYFCISYLNINKYWFDKNKYIPTSKRNSYIIQNVNDTLITNYASKNKNTLIIFWASWCEECIEEANELNNFINNNPDIPIIVVSFDKNISNLESYLASNNYNWFTVFDPDRKIRQSLDEDTKGIPAAYLINSNLNVLSKEISAMTEDEFLTFYNLSK